jgi:hypothetical protein
MDVTYYVALPFVVADDGVAAGEAVECLSANAAVMRAEALSRKPGCAGAIAFCRTGDPATGEFSDHIGIALASTWQLAQRGCVTTASIRFHASNPSARLTLPGGSASLTISSLAATIPVRAAIDEAAITTAIRELFMARPSHETP